MEVKVLHEAGYEFALRGMAYSYFDNSANPMDWWTVERFEKAIKRSELLCGKGAGHDKFLRQIVMWVDINAPRFWWSEFDTYKIGTVAQSTSTMHTLKKGVTSAHFEYPELVNIESLNEFISYKPSIEQMKAALPEGFLQRRIVTLNYGVLWTIVQQRHDHRLPQWQQFIGAIRGQCDHPELLWSQN